MRCPRDPWDRHSGAQPSCEQSVYEPLIPLHHDLQKSDTRDGQQGSHIIDFSQRLPHRTGLGGGWAVPFGKVGEQNPNESHAVVDQGDPLTPAPTLVGIWISSAREKLRVQHVWCCRNKASHHLQAKVSECSGYAGLWRLGGMLSAFHAPVVIHTKAVYNPLFFTGTNSPTPERAVSSPIPAPAPARAMPPIT